MVKMRVNWGRAPENSSTNLFVVTNTSFNDLFVLARGHDVAMQIAYTANHIHGSQEIHKDYYFRNARKISSPNAIHARGFSKTFPEQNLDDYLELIQTAIYSNVEGSIHCKDGKIYIGDDEITNIILDT
jgi:hypothetical protein